MSSPESDDIIVDCIEITRKKNNVCWMTILRIALEHAPERTKEVLREINKNDQEVSKWLGRLAD